MDRWTRDPRRTTHLATMSLALVMILAACSSTGSSSAASSATPAGSAAAADVTVTLQGNAFTATGADTSGSVPTLTIQAGQSVAFVNADAHAHTATHGENGTPDASPKFDFDLSAKGSSGVFTFADAGTFHVTCKIHSSMNLTIVVQ